MNDKEVRIEEQLEKLKRDIEKALKSLRNDSEIKENVEKDIKDKKEQVNESRRSGKELNKGDQKGVVETLLKARIVATEDEYKDIRLNPFAKAVLSEIREEDLAKVNNSQDLLFYLGDYLSGERDINIDDKLSDEFKGKIEELAKKNEEIVELVVDALEKEKLVKEDEIRELKKVINSLPDEREGEDDEEKLRRFHKGLKEKKENIEMILDEVEIDKEKLKEDGYGDDKHKDVLKEIKANLKLNISELNGAESKKERAYIAGRAMKDIDNSYLTEDSKKELKKALLDYVDYLNEHQAVIDKLVEGKGVLLGDVAEQRYNVTLSDESKKILNCVSNERVFERCWGKGIRDGDISFKDIKERVLLVAEEILSSVKYTPDEPFEESFSQFYEKALYKALIRKISNLGESLEGELANKRVKVEELEVLRGPHQEGKGAEERLTYTVIREKNFNQALVDNLKSDLIRSLRLSRSLHNIEYIVDNGLGWEKLAGYADMLDTKDVDRLFKEDMELVVAYNLYISALRSEFSSNYKIIPSSFGLKGSDGLDNEQRSVLAQLISLYHPGAVNSPAIRNKLIRKIRLATALAKGYTGEYWGVALTSSVALSYEELKDAAEGMGDQERRELEVKLKETFSGLHAKGIEKMITDINLVKLFERFGLPHHNPALRFVYVVRDLSKKEGWDHTLTYWVEENYKKAYLMGASEDFLEFLRTHKLFLDILRFSSVDVLQREGWRKEQYKAALVFEREGGKLLFDRTLLRMMATGSPFAMYFIEDLDKYIDKIDPDSIVGVSWLDNETKGMFRRISRERSEKVKEKYIKKLKQHLFKEYVFRRILDITPMQVINLERRLYTPRKEKLVIEELIEMLKNNRIVQSKFEGVSTSLIRDKIFPLLMNAVTLAQKKELSERREKAWGEIYKGEDADLNAVHNLLSYKFKLDLNNPGIDEMLRSFFDISKETFCETIIDYSGREITLGEDFNYDDFKTILSQFVETLRDSVDRERVRRKGEVYEGERAGERFRLEERFYHWYKDLGILGYDIGGEDLDFSHFPFEQAGSRMTSRSFGDAGSFVAKEIVPSVKKIVFDEIANFTLAEGLTGKDQKLKFIKRNIFPHVLKIVNAVDMYAGESDAHETAARFSQILRRILGDDDKFAMLGVGSALKFFSKRFGFRQPSLMQDFFKSTVLRKTNSLSWDESWKMMLDLMTAAKLPLEKRRIKKYEEKKFLFFKYKRPVYEESENKVYINKVLESEGFTTKNMIINRFIPIGFVIALIILFQLMRQANKKNKK